MMKKKIIAVTVTGILFIAAAGTYSKALEGSSGSYGPPGFTVDGKAVVFDKDLGLPYISETGRTMMPIRSCLESIGCYVEWNGETKSVFTSKGNMQVSIPIGKEEITINQQSVPTDTAAVIKDGRTYLPLRAVLQAYGYRVDWDGNAGIVYAASPEKLAYSPSNINGGTTGVFSRKQLDFSGFTGIEGDITLPTVTLSQRECPYVYFGFDWANDAGNAEGGFQLTIDPQSPDYGKWGIYLRQGASWQWGGVNDLEQGSTHHLKFYSDIVSDQETDLVIELDGREVIRRASDVTDFRITSVKTVTSMAMSNPFDGTNCFSISDGTKFENLKVLAWGADQYSNFGDFNLYSEWKPAAGKGGMWFGTVDAIPSYIHYGEDGSVSIYSERLPLEQKTLASAVVKREYGDPGNVTVTDQYIYYENDKGQIIQVPLSDPSVMKVVYQLPAWDYGQGEYVYDSLLVENGSACLKYHQGGAVMGSDFLIRLNDDGTTTELQNSYNQVKTFGDKTFTYWTGAAPGPGNLSMKIGDEEYKPLGDPDYLYGWAWKNYDDGSEGGGGSDDAYLIGDELYMLAFDYMKPEKDATTGIYRINVNTGETVRVNDKEIMAFKLEGDFLYYQNNGIFYRQSIKDNKEEQIGKAKPDDLMSIPGVENGSSPGVENFLVLNGKIYWQNQADHGLYGIDGRKINSSLITGYLTAVLDSMEIMGSGGEYLVCTFEDAGSAYRIMVFDRDGKVVFKSYDKSYCRNISIFGDQIYFYNQTTGTVCIGQLQ